MVDQKPAKAARQFGVLLARVIQPGARRGGEKEKQKKTEPPGPLPSEGRGSNAREGVRAHGWVASVRATGSRTRIRPASSLLRNHSSRDFSRRRKYRPSPAFIVSPGTNVSPDSRR